MNINEFSRLMAQHTGRPIYESAEIVRDFLDTFAIAVAQKEVLRFSGYFTLDYKTFQQREIVVPRQEDPVIVPKRDIPRVHVSKQLYEGGKKFDRSNED